jgi:peroxiredoxin Q/BCP
MSRNPKHFIDYWYKNEIPFFGIPDAEHKLANLYGQKVDIFKLVRMPALFVIAKEGRIRYRHYGNSMSAIPEN